uniref:ParB/RepB/Spo0J family partition protein n=1 Tax=Nosocomiicoccus ampullae TaxID=489910 RepID=UPI000830978C|nr:ParB/RepB/Spo0J family partition protein [Nosocomiicoccus ampullae]
MNLMEQTFEKISTKKLPLKGKTEVLNVYRIPINHLKYNVKNGRIATFVSQYLDEEGPLPEDKEEFNKIIEKFIVDSNFKAFNNTKNNIRELGQMEPAVVLSDGIVIDGNRRFTVLRQLNREESNSAKFEYIDAVILDRKIYNEKDVKRLELNLQHGLETRVDYNPVERLVDIYETLIAEDINTGKPLFTIKEYARDAQMKESEVKKDKEVAELLLEYLEFLHQPKKFHIAREQKVDGPLREVHLILSSRKLDQSKLFEIKEFLFANLLTLKEDPTRMIRALRKPLEDERLKEELLEKSEDTLDKIDEVLSSNEVQDEVEKTGIVNVPIEIQENIIQVTEDAVDSSKLEDARNQPIEALRKAVNNIKQVDKNSLTYFNDELRNGFNDYLSEAENLVKDLREVLEDAE